MGNMDIQIIKSRRRTVSIEVHTDGSVILRAPNRITKKELDILTSICLGLRANSS